MPFTDIFMTLVLLFSGGRKQRGGPGAAGTLTGGSGGGFHVSHRSTQLGKNWGSHSVPPLPSGTLLSSPCTGRASFPSLVKAWLARRNPVIKLGVFLQCSDCSQEWSGSAESCAQDGEFRGTHVLPPQHSPQIRVFSCSGRGNEKCLWSRDLLLGWDGRWAGWGCSLKRWKTQLRRPLHPHQMEEFRDW